MFLRIPTVDHQAVVLLGSYATARTWTDASFIPGIAYQVIDGETYRLANIYLHYVLDLWVKWWRKKQASDEVIIIRYADDFVMGSSDTLIVRIAMPILDRNARQFDPLTLPFRRWHGVSIRPRAPAPRAMA